MNGEKLPGNWVYGGILQGSGNFSIIYTGSEVEPFEKFVVYSDTVGQCTGLTDKNGVKIFEGDIIEHHVQGLTLVTRGVVEWDNKCGRWASRLNTMRPDFYMHNPDAVEVIGNIYDNPELLTT